MWKSPRETKPEPALLPLVTQSEHPCHGCAKCCLYVAIEIDSPTSMTEYDHVVWYLYHENVSVLVDWEGQWFVKFDTRCKNLTPSGLCGIYESRLAICKDFDWRECENHMTAEEGPPDKWLWDTPEAFLAWFEKQRPKAFRRYRDFMKSVAVANREHHSPQASATGTQKISAPSGISTSSYLEEVGFLGVGNHPREAHRFPLEHMERSGKPESPVGPRHVATENPAAINDDYGAGAGGFGRNRIGADVSGFVDLDGFRFHGFPISCE